MATSVKLEPSEAVHDLFKQLKLPFGKKIIDAGFINLYVCPEFMDQFSKINEAYNMYFGSQPPGRACVAVSLFGEVKACIDVMFCDTALRKTVHVTSRSYWAPANIGPYSQYCLVSPRPVFFSRCSNFDLSLPRSIIYFTRQDKSACDRRLWIYLWRRTCNVL